jgi:hypothetical protein
MARVARHALVQDLSHYKYARWKIYQKLNTLNPQKCLFIKFEQNEQKETDLKGSKKIFRSIYKIGVRFDPVLK